jgi:hypothetical protein
VSADSERAVAPGATALAAATAATAVSSEAEAGEGAATVVAPAAAGGSQDVGDKVDAGLEAAVGQPHGTAADEDLEQRRDAELVSGGNQGREGTSGETDEEQQHGLKQRRREYGGVGMEGVAALETYGQQQGQSAQDGGGKLQGSGSQLEVSGGADFMRWDVARWTEVLQRETQLRLSSETQSKYAAAEKRHDTDWMEVTGGLQEQVLREHGVAEALLPAALRALRTAPYKFPQLKQFCIYHKYQRSRQGPAVGSKVPDVMMVKLREVQQGASGGSEAALDAAGRGVEESGGSCGEMVPLLSCFTKPEQQLLVVFAGSYS